MSMKILTIFQATGAFMAYSAVTLLLPWLFLRDKLKKYSHTDQLLCCFLTGNFYIINLVFLLEFLHISNLFTLLLGTALPFLIRFYKKNKGRFREVLEDALILIQNILLKKVGIKTLVLRGIDYLKLQELTKDKRKKILFATEALLVIVLIGGVVAIYGKSLLVSYGFKASDEPVHNYWINLLERNKIFSDGVYPHGFHCILYYLHKISGIKVYVLLRVFAIVQNIYIHLILLIVLRGICKTVAAPYIGTYAYLFLNIFSNTTYQRFVATLPQEYGMLFVFPVAYFAFRFIEEKKLVFQKESDEETAKIEKRCKLYLLGLCVSLSLTLSAHFYDTLIAGVLCIGIALGFIFRTRKWKYLKHLILSAVIGISLAIAPMAIGLAMGNKPQGSLEWAIGVLKGEQSEDTVGAQVVQKSRTQSADAQEEGTVFKILDVVCRYVANGSVIMTFIIVLCIIVLAAFSVFVFLAGDSDYGGVMLSVSIYMLLMCVFISMYELGLPQLMESYRVCIFFAYSLAAVWALLADSIVYLCFRKCRKKWILQLVPAGFLIAGSCAAVVLGGLKKPVGSKPLEMNEAVTCLTNIIKTEKKNSWTIVSANDERSMVYGSGYHYEMINFLRELQNIEDSPEVTIPTGKVFFFVEKYPVDYANKGTLNRKIAQAGAQIPLSDEDGITPYLNRNRWVTMSHMYYWAERFMKLYPGDMEVYYEDENFVCFKLEQNTDSLYNLAIDYSYNGSSKE